MKYGIGDSDDLVYLLRSCIEKLGKHGINTKIHFILLKKIKDSFNENEEEENNDNDIDDDSQ